MPRTSRRRVVPEGLTAPPAVVIDGVSASYDGDLVLDEVSVAIEPSRTLIVMGPSGVGKTTLIRTVLGFLDPDQGAVTVDGRSVQDLPPVELREVRRNIGVLLGGSSIYDASVFASMTALANVRYPLEARGYDEATIDARSWHRMIEFELTAAAHLLPSALSAGMRRRLALARAFVDDPPLLVLDDPGAAMDVFNRKKIIESIRRAQQATSATVILACHDIEMARALGDDMVVLLGGRVVEAGPVSDLLDGVVDADTYDARFGIRRSFAVTDASSRSTFGRVLDARREDSSWQWSVYFVLAILGFTTLIAFMSGVMDNVFTW